jgi:hypothetical protein
MYVSTVMEGECDNFPARSYIETFLQTSTENVEAEKVLALSRLVSSPSASQCRALRRRLEANVVFIGEGGLSDGLSEIFSMLEFSDSPSV